MNSSNPYARENKVQHLVYICVAIAVGLAALALNSVGMLQPILHFLGLGS
jgi:hypothetical protein